MHQLWPTAEIVEFTGRHRSKFSTETESENPIKIKYQIQKLEAKTANSILVEHDSATILIRNCMCLFTNQMINLFAI